ncbi:MAG: CBS domain-containing protein [Nitrospirae bacterium]|nr:CBS domain-containing protein [Nitrospirota bacterium]MBF0521371.1 CBS domain-containing protein [Nitrospirota bacterium]MBF0535142.1 CBS domain-containing protein [Nitrospirota bacterium]MBF0615239.1 CBS domain-containing protein [Nitrospirota bacterium]
MKAKDIMEVVCQSITHSDTIKTAIRKMLCSRGAEGITRVRGLHVVDDDGQLIGMLSMINILKAVHPNYMELGEDLSAFTWDGMLETLVKKIADMPVSNIMSKTTLYVEENAPLMKCLDILLKHNVRRLPVVNGQNQVIGIIHIRDLYNVVIKTLLDDEWGGK